MQHSEWNYIRKSFHSKDLIMNAPSLPLCLMFSLILNVNLSLSLSLTEIEAKEACTWLRAAGFPQYAQLYEGRIIFFPTSPVPN